MATDIWQNTKLIDLPQEKWKYINGYEGIFQVSTYGRVKSLKRLIIKKNGQRIELNEKILHQSDNGKGYKTVILTNESKSKHYYVHRLVAECYIGEIDGKEINHKDKNKSNNVVSNLEICTKKYNLAYSYDDIYGTLLRKVFRYNVNGVFDSQFNSITDAAKKHNVVPATIVAACVRGCRVKGYMFRYYKKDKIEPYYRKYKKIIVYDINGTFYKAFDSAKAASDFFDIKYNSIISAINKGTKLKNNYYIKYK